MSIASALWEHAAKAYRDMAAAEESLLRDGAKTVARWWTNDGEAIATWHVQGFAWKPEPKLMQAFEDEVGARCEWITWEDV